MVGGPNLSCQLSNFQKLGLGQPSYRYASVENPYGRFTIARPRLAILPVCQRGDSIRQISQPTVRTFLVRRYFRVNGNPTYQQASLLLIHDKIRQAQDKISHFNGRLEWKFQTGRFRSVHKFLVRRCHGNHAPAALQFVYARIGYLIDVQQLSYPLYMLHYGF